MKEVPEKYQTIMQDLLQQLIEFEQAYGTIPRVKLVTQSNYEDLMKRLQDKIYNRLEL
jgi:hypothetical protein